MRTGNISCFLLRRQFQAFSIVTWGVWEWKMCEKNTYHSNYNSILYNLLKEFLLTVFRLIILHSFNKYILNSNKVEVTLVN
jgi:hypothetical protein